MHRNMVDQCSCGSFHSQSNSFCGLSSMMPSNYKVASFDEAGVYTYTTSSSSSSVDCTLSLGTPSTRLGLGSAAIDGHDQPKQSTLRPSSNASSCMSSFCWDFLHTKHTSSNKPSRIGGNGNNGGSFDPLLARRCANCDTTSTPLWRNGPRGPKSLCNACGIRFKKEERRANAAAATTPNGAAAGAFIESQAGHQNNAWIHHSQTTQKIPCLSPAIGNEFRFIEDDNRDSDAGISFLSWRLNVTDRPGLVQYDFTR